MKTIILELTKEQLEALKSVLSEADLVISKRVHCLIHSIHIVDTPEENENPTGIIGCTGLDA